MALLVPLKRGRPLHNIARENEKALRLLVHLPGQAELLWAIHLRHEHHPQSVAGRNKIFFYHAFHLDECLATDRVLYAVSGRTVRIANSILGSWHTLLTFPPLLIITITTFPSNFLPTGRQWPKSTISFPFGCEGGNKSTTVVRKQNWPGRRDAYSHSTELTLVHA